MKIKNCILILFLIFLSNNIFAQAKKSEVLSKNSKGEANFIKLKETKVASDISSVKDFLKKQYKFNDDVNYLQKENSLTIENNIETQKLQQYYKGIKVEFSELVISSKNNTLKSVNGNSLLIENLSINPILSESEALNSILNKINSQLYAWQSNSFENLLKTEKNNSNATYFPKGKLVIIDNDLYDDISEPILAYKFDIYSLKPLSRSNYYINASNGELILKDAIIKHVQGPADTRYSGTRTIETEQVGSSFRLRDNTRGNGIETYNMNNSTNYASATDFLDNNNNWTNTEYDNSNKDNAILDAHWGAEMTYDYFLQNHNRDSYDNNGAVIKSYVHYSNNYENAFWDGQRMTYGDGNTTFDALTSIDVVAHEIGHGVCSNTANLVYQNESGAINEGLSDIWGAMVEFNAAPGKDTYLIGEEIILSGTSLRSMINPNSGLSAQPDTYQGNFWHTGSSDNGGVHTNSGVMNFWFYLLAEGGSGINDNGDIYNVSGIDKIKAAKIVYRAESIYFTSTTNYHQARDLTIQAADDLYGENSGESFNVANAWYAVGIGADPNIGYSNYISGPTQLTPGYRAFYSMNAYPNATNYVWSIPSGCHYHYCWGITQGQGTNVLGIKAGKTGRQDITCTIYNGSTIIGSQYITVNVQNPYGGGGNGGGDGDPCGGVEMINGVIYPPDPCDTNGFASGRTNFKHVKVYDFTGKKLIELRNVDSFNIDFLSSGLYIIKLEMSNSEIITKKILK